MTTGGLATVILTDAMAVIIMVLGGAVLSIMGMLHYMFESHYYLK